MYIILVIPSRLSMLQADEVKRIEEEIKEMRKDCRQIFDNSQPAVPNFSDRTVVFLVHPLVGKLPYSEVSSRKLLPLFWTPLLASLPVRPCQAHSLLLRS